MATIERRKSRGKTVYYAKVRIKGQAQSATFHSLSKARQWSQRVEVGILEGKVSPVKHTLSGLLDRYMAEVLPQKKASTIPTQRAQLLWWKRQLGQWQLSEVTPARILDCRTKLQRLSNGTINRYTAVLSHVFTLATEWQWCQENPVRKLRKLREPRGRVRYLSDEERHRLLKACKVSANRDLYLLAVLAISTGARKGELAKLTWNTINLERGTLTFIDTKNSTNRTVPVTGLALELLREKPRKPGKLFARNWRKAFETAVRRAGLVDLRWHDLRHSAASYLAMNGANLLEIAEILGHKSLEMVKRYAHLSEAHTRQVVARMNAAIFDSHGHA
jgi:integrase